MKYYVFRSDALIPEYISDLDDFTTSTSIRKAQHVAATDLDMIDLDYLAEENFYPVDTDTISGYDISAALLLGAMIFKPRAPHHRPRRRVLDTRRRLRLPSRPTLLHHKRDDLHGGAPRRTSGVRVERNVSTSNGRPVRRDDRGPSRGNPGGPKRGFGR